jgi:hypothetical protein
MDGVAGDPPSVLGREEGDTPPMSSGWATRLNACMPKARSRPASVLVKFDISVATTPGATALTRMCRSPSSEAKCFTIVSMAPFVVA